MTLDFSRPGKPTERAFGAWRDTLGRNQITQNEIEHRQITELLHFTLAQNLPGIVELDVSRFGAAPLIA